MWSFRIRIALDLRKADKGGGKNTDKEKDEGNGRKRTKEG